MEKMNKHKKQSGMMDNNKVKDSHQEGIGRVLQRPGDMETGVDAHMKSKGHANWKRSDSKLTPRAG